jgi:hypothetical protein
MGFVTPQVAKTRAVSVWLVPLAGGFGSAEINNGDSANAGGTAGGDSSAAANDMAW